MRVRYTTYMLVLAAGLEMACRPGPSTLPLVAAAERGDTAALRALLASGVEVDAVDDQGATALVPAARGGVVARIEIEPPRSQLPALHRPIAYESGQPMAVIAFSTLHATTASTVRPPGVLARRPSPMIDLYRKKAFLDSRLLMVA